MGRRGLLDGWRERLAVATGQRPLQLRALTSHLLELHGAEAVAALPAEALRWPALAGAARCDFAARLTYADVHLFVERVAAALTARPVGLAPGERVGVVTRNTYDHALLCWAVWRAGGVAVPLGQRLKPAEVEHALADAGAAVVIVEQATLAETTGELARHAGVRAWLSIDGAPRGALPGRPLWDLDRLAAEAPEARGAAAALDAPGAAKSTGRAGDDVAAIFYTSGTTGQPKGAMLSAAGLCAPLRAAALSPLTTALGTIALAARGGSGDEDGAVSRPAALAALPLSHIYGFEVALLLAVAGLPLRHHTSFRADGILDALERDRPVLFAGVPTMYQMLLDAGAEARDLSSVKVFVSAADVLASDVMARFKRLGALGRVGPLRIPALFLDGYGMVEMSGAAVVRVSLPGLDRLDRGGFWGVPLPGVRTRVVGADGRDLPRGEVGELWVQSAGLLRGYVGRDDDSRRALQDGWLRTGDLARRTRLGFVRFAGRARDVLKVGGYSVFPAEIEARLCQHPAVALAAVFGAPHPHQGEVPVAVVVPRDGVPAPDEPELVAFAAARLAAYKAPRRVLLAAMTDLPLGPTGKVVKGALREKFLPLLHPAPAAGQGSAIGS
jgi:acyl-CoA synthetase (AMP-forming)/AMP-acid ligase II